MAGWMRCALSCQMLNCKNETYDNVKEHALRIYLQNKLLKRPNINLDQLNQGVERLYEEAIAGAQRLAMGVVQNHLNNKHQGF